MCQARVPAAESTAVDKTDKPPAFAGSHILEAERLCQGGQSDQLIKHVT